jgi:XTP/dITP diphosphohydrolase
MLQYVTTNPGKVREARAYLDTIEPLDYDYTEVQADELEPIAAQGAREAYREANRTTSGETAVIVDDAGLFVEGLDGFPGPYSAYVQDTLGVEAVGQLAREQAADEHGVIRAMFRCAIAYCDGEGFAATPEPVDLGDRRGADLSAEDRGRATIDDTVTGGDLPVKLFTGSVPGRIVASRGQGGFGYDPIFEHDGQTLAEMTTDEKNAISHRGRALAKFAEWLQTTER